MILMEENGRCVDFFCLQRGVEKFCDKRFVSVDHRVHFVPDVKEEVHHSNYSQRKHLFPNQKIRKLPLRYPVAKRRSFLGTSDASAASNDGKNKYNARINWEV